MPAPLLWLGAAVAGLYASNKANERYLKHTSVVGHFPGESTFRVRPVNGAIVSCGIFGVLDHTGIWFNGKIIELNGDGLIRSISPSRFLQNRSGDKIYIACDNDFNVLFSESSVSYCIDNLYDYRHYDVLSNNCHRFVSEAILGVDTKVTSFSDLNEVLNQVFTTTIHWHQLNF